MRTRGPYPAFIGSLTREKVSGKIYMIPQASRPLKIAERLFNWRIKSKAIPVTGLGGL
jgi:hypothetical protein